MSAPPDGTMTDTSGQTMNEALERAIAAQMRADEAIVCFGTRPPDPISREFGSPRVWTMPISEAGFSGAAVGAAACGLRPIVFWRNITFSFVAFDSIINQVSKLAYMSGNQRRFPVLFVATCGGGLRLAAQHSQSPYSIFAHLPGIDVYLPSTAVDAALAASRALQSDRPTILLLPSLLENAADRWSDSASRTRTADLGGTRTRRLGADMTIVALGNMVGPAIEASEMLSQRGISAEVLDPFCLSPLDIDSIKSSVLRTRRAIVVDEAPRACSIASEIAASLMEDPEVFRALRHPVARVNGAAVPIPYSPPLEDAVLPSVKDVISMVLRCMDQE